MGAVFSDVRWVIGVVGVCLLVMARGCTAMEKEAERGEAGSQGLRIVGLADRELVKVRSGMIDPAVLEREVHEAAFRDAWVRSQAYWQGVKFELERAVVGDAV